MLIFGLIAVFMAQWLLSWCNVFGLLPVMGQPMTWMSFGSSHHLLVVVPSIAAMLLALKYWQSMRLPPNWHAPPLRWRSSWISSIFQRGERR